MYVCAYLPSNKWTTFLSFRSHRAVTICVGASLNSVIDWFTPPPEEGDVRERKRDSEGVRCEREGERGEGGRE